MGQLRQRGHRMSQ